MIRQNWLAVFILFIALLLTCPALAAEAPAVGDTCTAGETGHSQFVGGDTEPNGHWVVCNGTTWAAIIDFSAAAGRSLFQVDNDTGTCTAAKLGRIRYNGTSTWEYCNGTTWTTLGGGGSGGAFDVAMFMPNTPYSGAIVRVNFARAVQFPINLTGSNCKAKTAATASTTVTLNKISGGTTTAIGTAVWAAAATTCTFTFSSAVSFAAGDIIEFSFPTTPDTTITNVSITLAGT
jgi:hypothetical protein